MAKYYDGISKRTKGAWVVHHGQKTGSAVNGPAEFSAIDAAGKAAALLSQLASSQQAVVERQQVNALAKSAGLNPRIELPALLQLLVDRRVIQMSSNGDVEVLGLTSAATVGHAAELFEEQLPSTEEQATIAIAELTSIGPLPAKSLNQFISDEFKLSAERSDALITRSEAIGFVDAEGQNADKLFFNGNLFRRSSLTKTAKILDSISSAESAKVSEVEALLKKRGCLKGSEVQKILGAPLFDKLRAAGMYDINLVANPSGEFGFVTSPAAFHKFNDPLTDDAFDLAKALVAALFYGMTTSSPGRGKIEIISLLLSRLIEGRTIGPATAIGEDYRVLETKGVIRVTPGPKYGYLMKLLKRDIGEMALKVLTTGETASTNSLERSWPGQMTGYSGPEKTRSGFRLKQSQQSKTLMQDVLQALRTKGNF